MGDFLVALGLVFAIEGLLFAAMMLKDLKLAQDAAQSAGAKTRLGRSAAEVYAEYVASGEAGKDFSGIIQHVRKP